MPALQAKSRPRFSYNTGFPPFLAGAEPPCRLLVVDDDEWMRLYLASILRSTSYDVDVADSGEEALRLLRDGPYDILLTDCLMPGMDGLSLCQRVRTEFPVDSPYILMFTVKDTREDRYAGFRSGADEYIIKGAPTGEVCAKLDAGRRIRRQNAIEGPALAAMARLPATPLVPPSAPSKPLFHTPLSAADAARSRCNIALWNSYLHSPCVRSMVRMGWDYTT